MKLREHHPLGELLDGLLRPLAPGDVVDVDTYTDAGDVLVGVGRVADLLLVGSVPEVDLPRDVRVVPPPEGVDDRPQVSQERMVEALLPQLREPGLGDRIEIRDAARHVGLDHHVGILLGEAGQPPELGLGRAVFLRQGFQLRHASADGCQLVEEAGRLVHGAHEVDHLVECLGGRLDDDVDAVTEHVEVEVGDQGCDLDQRVGAEVEPGHLAVDPDQSLVHEAQPYAVGPPPQPGFRTVAYAHES